MMFHRDMHLKYSLNDKQSCPLNLNWRLFGGGTSIFFSIKYRRYPHGIIVLSISSIRTFFWKRTHWVMASLYDIFFILISCICSSYYRYMEYMYLYNSKVHLIHTSMSWFSLISKGKFSSPLFLFHIHNTAIHRFYVVTYYDFIIFFFFYIFLK